MQRIERDEGMMSGYSRWWSIERKVTSTTSIIVAQQGGRNSAGSLNRQFNRPSRNHLAPPSTPILKGSGRRSVVARHFIVPTTPSTSAPSTRGLTTWMPSACRLVGEGSEPGHLNSQFRHFKISPSTPLLSRSHPTHTPRVTGNC